MKTIEQRTGPGAGQNWRLDSLHTTERSDTMEEPLQLETEASNVTARLLKSAATNKQGAESEELKLLLQLAQKYGYVITEQSEAEKQAKELSEKQPVFDEKTTGKGMDACDNATQISVAPSDETQNENKR